jgi:ubiquinone/menaquinone biosynthesis C-methylase UbiE
MRSFWDDKARENATYYISSYRAFDEQDPEEFWKWGQKLAEQFLAESGLAFTGRETMLEIGCGIGRMTAYFSKQFRAVHGLDVSPEMISQAEKNLAGLDNVTLHIGNGYDLSGLEDQGFDFVFSYIVFQHIPDPGITARYIEETGRVLKKGGDFYFQVNNSKANWRTRLRLGTRLRALMRSLGLASKKDVSETGPTGLDNPAWRGSRMSVSQVRVACEAGGLNITRLMGEGSQYMWVKAEKK